MAKKRDNTKKSLSSLKAPAARKTRKADFEQVRGGFMAPNPTRPQGIKLTEVLISQ